MKPPSQAGHLFASPAWSPGIWSRAAFLNQAAAAVLIPCLRRSLNAQARRIPVLAATNPVAGTLAVSGP